MYLSSVMAAPPVGTKKINARSLMCCDTTQRGRWKAGRSPITPRNAECRLSTVPLDGCGLPKAASLQQAEAHYEYLPSSAVVHRHGTMPLRTTRPRRCCRQRLPFVDS